MWIELRAPRPIATIRHHAWLRATDRATVRPMQPPKKITCVALETYLAIFFAALNLAQHCSTTTAFRIRHLDSNSRRAAILLALHWMRVAAAA